MPKKSLDEMKFIKLTGNCPSCQAEVKNQGRCPGCGAYFRKDGTVCFAGKALVKPQKKEIKANEKIVNNPTVAKVREEKAQEKRLFDW